MAPNPPTPQGGRRPLTQKGLPRKKPGPAPKPLSERLMQKSLKPVRRVERSYPKERKIEVLLYLLNHRVPDARPRKVPRRRIGQPHESELTQPMVRDENGELVWYRAPTYAEASEFWKIPTPTIQGWWDSRDKLLEGTGIEVPGVGPGGMSTALLDAEGNLITPPAETPARGGTGAEQQAAQQEGQRQSSDAAAGANGSVEGTSVENGSQVATGASSATPAASTPTQTDFGEAPASTGRLVLTNEVPLLPATQQPTAVVLELLPAGSPAYRAPVQRSMARPKRPLSPPRLPPRLAPGTTPSPAPPPPPPPPPPARPGPPTPAAGRRGAQQPRGATLAPQPPPSPFPPIPPAFNPSNYVIVYTGPHPGPWSFPGQNCLPPGALLPIVYANQPLELGPACFATVYPPPPTARPVYQPPSPHLGPQVISYPQHPGQTPAYYGPPIHPPPGAHPPSTARYAPLPSGTPLRTQGPPPPPARAQPGPNTGHASPLTPHQVQPGPPPAPQPPTVASATARSVTQTPATNSQQETGPVAPTHPPDAGAQPLQSCQAPISAQSQAAPDSGSAPASDTATPTPEQERVDTAGNAAAINQVSPAASGDVTVAQSSASPSVEPDEGESSMEVDTEERIKGPTKPEMDAAADTPMEGYTRETESEAASMPEETAMEIDTEEAAQEEGLLNVKADNVAEEKDEDGENEETAEDEDDQADEEEDAELSEEQEDHHGVEGGHDDDDDEASEDQAAETPASEASETSEASMETAAESQSPPATAESCFPAATAAVLASAMAQSSF